MREYSPEEILNGVQNMNADVLNYIYENYFYQIRALIDQNFGTRDDAKDIFQDAILTIYQKLQKEKTTLNCSFNTYFYSVCRLLWLKQLEQRKLKKLYLEESGEFVELDEKITTVIEANDRYKIYQDHFKKLSFNCQKILELFLAGISVKEIARILRYRSGDYIKKRKHYCKENLVASIKKDPRYKEITKMK
ncbi:MAG: hypothetical protein K8R37_01015 [Bacteroidales bacterium]|nr:hypothetical protein [Bacteroidales bacterium]